MAHAVEREPRFREHSFSRTKEEAGLIAQSGLSYLAIVSRAALPHNQSPNSLTGLEQIPQELVVHVVVILDFGSFHKRPQQPRTAIRRSLL